MVAEVHEEAVRSQRWTLVLTLFATTSVVETFGVGHVIRFMPLYLKQLGTPASQIPTWAGLLSASIFLFGLPLVPFWGVWADRYSRKLIIARSAFVEMVVFFGLGLSQNRYEVGASLLLVGLQLGNTGIMLAAIRAVTPPTRLGFAISIFGLTPSIGMALGPPLGGLLVDHGILSLHGLFILDGVLSLAAGLLLLYAFHEDPRPHLASGSMMRQAMEAVTTALTTPVTRALFIIFGLAILAQQISNPFFPLLVQRIYSGHTGLATTIGVVFGAAALVGALLSPVAGLLGDRYGFRRVLVAASVTACLSLVAIALAPNIPSLALSALALGAATASGSSMIFALLATIVPEDRRSATLNLVYVPLYVAGIVGGSLGAVLVHAGLDVPVLVGAGLVLVGGGLALFLVPASTRSTGH